MSEPDGNKINRDLNGLLRESEAAEIEALCRKAATPATREDNRSATWSGRLPWGCRYPDGLFSRGHDFTPWWCTQCGPITGTDPKVVFGQYAEQRRICRHCLLLELRQARSTRA
jgi:hypothetical protein